MRRSNDKEDEDRDKNNRDEEEAHRKKKASFYFDPSQNAPASESDTESSVITTQSSQPPAPPSADSTTSVQHPRHSHHHHGHHHHHRTSDEDERRPTHHSRVPGWDKMVELAKVTARAARGSHDSGHSDPDHPHHHHHHHAQHHHHHPHARESHGRRLALQTSFIPTDGKKKSHRNIVKQLGTFISHQIKKKHDATTDDGGDVDSLASMDSSRSSMGSYDSEGSLDSERIDLDNISRKTSKTSRRLSTSSKRARFKGALTKIRHAFGPEELMREMRLRREEYAKKMESIWTDQQKMAGHAVHQDHPYVALRKKIEAMARKEGLTYSVDYRSFSRKAQAVEVGIPVYATGYDNERKKQARRRQFMFGLRNNNDRYDFDAEQREEYAEDPKHHSEKSWESKWEVNMAALALIFSAANLFRFPHACYINGGIIFLLVYCSLIVVLMQPLIHFEMLVGQFSFKGEWGFSYLHRLAWGFCYALLFVNMVFSTLQNSICGLTSLYAVQGLLTRGPGECDPSWGNSSNCIPYSALESKTVARALADRRRFLEGVKHNESIDLSYDPLFSAQVYLSTEIFFGLQVASWKGKPDEYHANYVILVAIILVLMMPSAIQTHAISILSKIWMNLACLLPLFLVLVFGHQYIFRRDDKTPVYFSDFKWDRLSTLVFWCDAFEMALSTVGVGFGSLIRISSRNEFKFQGLRRLSWIICFSTMIFCSLSALIVFTELAIIGRHSGAKDYVDVLAGANFGVSFICLSGALIKIGPIWIMTAFFGWITLFNFWGLMVTSQMGITYLTHWIPIRNMRIQYFLSWMITTIAQLLIISLYIYHTQFAETDSFDLFGGSGAACVMLAVEMGIAFILCGYREFMTDIEIMQDIPMTFAFQAQMKYWAPYVILVAYFVIAISWFLDPPRHQSPELVDGVEVKRISQSTFWLGFIMNFIPILLLPLGAYWGFRKSRKKVAPVDVDVNSKIVEKKTGVKNFWKSQSRWKMRRGGVISRNATALNTPRSRWEIFYDPSTGGTGLLGDKLAQFELRMAYDAHTQLRDKLRKLHTFLRARFKWINAMDKILDKQPLRSFATVVTSVQRNEELEITELELSLIRRVILSSSTINLAPCALRQIGTLKRMKDKETLLLDRLLDSASVRSDDEDSEEDSEDEEEHPHAHPPQFHPKRVSSVDYTFDPSASAVHSTSSMESGVTSAYQRVVGKPVKTEQELKLDISIRVRRALDLPYYKELAELWRLRKERLAKLRGHIQRFDPPPQEFFITIQITDKVKRSVPTPPFQTGIRVILLPYRNHFVLKKLPTTPFRPPIVFTTHSALARFRQGSNLQDKVFSLAIATLKRKWASGVEGGMSRKLRHRLRAPPNRTSLLNHLQDDVYSFIEPYRTCVIVLDEEKLGRELKNLPHGDKWRWLTPTLRRKTVLPPGVLEAAAAPPIYSWNYEEVTIAGLLGKELEEEKREEILLEASDILWHPSGEGEPFFRPLPETLSSAPIPHLPHQHLHHSTPDEVKDAVKKAIRRKTKGPGSHSDSGDSSKDSLSSDPMALTEARLATLVGRPQTAYSHLPLASAPHLTEKGWKRRKEEVHNAKRSTVFRPGGFPYFLSHPDVTDTGEVPPISIARARWLLATDKIMTLNHMAKGRRSTTWEWDDTDLFMQPLFELSLPSSDASRFSMDTRGSVAQSRSVVVFSNLMNDYNQYRYHSEGLTLVIKKFENIHRHERSRRQARGDHMVDSTTDVQPSPDDDSPDTEMEIGASAATLKRRTSAAGGGPSSRTRKRKSSGVKHKSKVRKVNRIKNMPQRYGPE